MAEEQASKLELLVRRNKGRREYQYYATELSHLLKTSIGPNNILDLGETDRLLACHRENALRSNKESSFAFRKKWPYEPLRVWSAACRVLGSKLGDEPAVLFVGPYEFCGAVRLDANRALDSAPSLLEFDRETVTLQSRDTESGLYLDLFEESSQSLIELVLWGHWKTIAAGWLSE